MTMPDAPGRPLLPREIRASLPMALLRAREAVMARFRPILSRHGINEQQWRVIRVLAEAGPLDASEVAARANILAPSLTRMLRTLEERGLIERARHDDDGRRVVVSVTQAARSLIATITPFSLAAYAEIEATFGAEKLAVLMRLLNDLADAKAAGRD